MTSFYRLRRREGLSAESLAELKVEELLGLSAWLPHYLRFEQFSYEVLAFKRYFHHNSDTLRVDPPEPLAVFGVCGMDCDLDPAWYFVDREIWEWLKTLPRSSTVSLGELAERYCQIRSVGRCADVELSEEELFLSYLKLIRGLMASGALIVWSGRHV